MYNVQSWFQVSVDSFTVTCGEKFLGALQSDKEYEVVYKHNDYPARVCHRAIDTVDSSVLDRMFPTEEVNEDKAVLEVVSFCNPIVEGNPEQRRAVTNIASLKGSVPVSCLVFVSTA